MIGVASKTFFPVSNWQQLQTVDELPKNKQRQSFIRNILSRVAPLGTILPGAVLTETF